MAKIILGPNCKPGEVHEIEVIVDGKPVKIEGDLILEPGMPLGIKCKSWTLGILELHVEEMRKAGV